MRDVIIVDCESTGLRPLDFAVEVGWYNYTKDTSGCFIPPHNSDWVLKNAEPEALEKNHYRDRILGQPQDEDGSQGRAFRAMVEGAVLLGSNVRQDAEWIMGMFLMSYDMMETTEPWYYRLLELGSLYLTVMGGPLGDPPGLDDICKFIGIKGGDHSAMGDVLVTLECVRQWERSRYTIGFPVD